MFLATESQPFSKLIIDSYRSFKPLVLKLLPAYIVVMYVTYINISSLSLPYMSDYIDFYPQLYNACFHTLILLNTTIIKYLTLPTNSFISSMFFLALIFCGTHMNSTDYLPAIISTFIYSCLLACMLNSAHFKLNNLLRQSSWFTLVKPYILNCCLSCILMLLVIASLLISVGIYNNLFHSNIVTQTILSLLPIIFCGILFIRFCYSFPLIASKQYSIGKSLRKSWVLTRGYFWKIIGATVATVIIPMIWFELISSLCQIILPESYPEFYTTEIVLQIISGIEGLIITTLVIGALYVFMNDSELKHRAKNVSSN